MPCRSDRPCSRGIGSSDQDGSGAAAKGLAVIRPDRVTLAAFVGFVLIAGAVSVAIRLGSFELPPFWAATLRYAMAVTIFTALAIVLRIPFRAARIYWAHCCSVSPSSSRPRSCTWG